MRKPRPLLTQKQALIIVQLLEGATFPSQIKGVVKSFMGKPNGAKVWSTADVIGSLLHQLSIKGYVYRNRKKEWYATELGAWTAINYFTEPHYSQT